MQKTSTDGHWGYIDVIYPGKHMRNISNKNDPFTVEGVNTGLRHYIPIPVRKNRCFVKKEALYKVIDIFVAAYNKFGITKYNYYLKWSC